MAVGQQDRQDVAKKISYLPRTRLLIVLNFWFLIFFNLQSFGEGLDFCFDGSKEGKVRNNCCCIFYLTKSELYILYILFKRRRKPPFICIYALKV